MVIWWICKTWTNHIHRCSQQVIRARLHFMWITSSVWISVWSDSKLDLCRVHHQKHLRDVINWIKTVFFINCFGNWVSVICYLQLLVVWKLIENSLNLVISLKYKILKKKKESKICESEWILRSWINQIMWWFI